MSLNNVVLLNSFCYSSEDMPCEFNSCLYQLAYVNWFRICRFTKVPEPINDVKSGFTVHALEGSLTFIFHCNSTKHVSSYLLTV